MPEKKIIAVVGATGQQGNGLIRAILNDTKREFTARALTRDPNSDKARALRELGAEVVQVDLQDESSVTRAFKGAHGAYCVTSTSHTCRPNENSLTRQFSPTQFETHASSTQSGQLSKTH